MPRLPPLVIKERVKRKSKKNVNDFMETYNSV